MFIRHEVLLISDPVCDEAVDGLVIDDFAYYDKDGFELNQAEQKYYRSKNFPLSHPILNHCCWQEPWFELENKQTKLILDHSMFLCRASYEKRAQEQLMELKKIMPTADLLLKTKRKWGFDFALDAIADDGTVYEVLHVEYDSHKYDRFKDRMIQFDITVRHTDWMDAAGRIWNQRDQWQDLVGFEQNHWKAKYLLGWKKAEYTRKSI